MTDKQLFDAANSALEAINSQLPPYERVDHILLMHEEWTAANGLLTPTMKIKRKKIEEIATPLIENSGQPVVID